MKVLTGREAEEYQHLYSQYRDAANKSYEMLVTRGMGSPEYLAAERDQGEIWRKLRAMQGVTVAHWMGQ